MCNESCENCMKDAPHQYCCKLECGEHEFCRGCFIMDNKSVENAKKKFIEELMKKIGTEKTPTVDEIIEYLEDKATFHPVGKMRTECYVNKEALRLAAVYLQDAYYER